MEAKFNAVINQSIFDISVQLYGNVLSLPGLIAGSLADVLDLSAAIPAGKELDYDLDDAVRLKTIVRNMENKIVETYKNTLNENEEYNTDFNFDFTS